MSGNKDQRSILNGISWSAFERLSAQGIQFLVFVFMARILSPEDYGLISILSIIILISQMVADGGVSQAIIRKINRTEIDNSTAFFANIATGIILYVILFAISPLLSQFFNEPQLSLILRVMAVTVILQSSTIVHLTLLSTRLDFKTQAKATLVAALFSGFVGLYMTYNGYGVWSLAGLHISNQAVMVITIWCISGWHPSMKFSTASFRELYGFGSKILASNVLTQLYQCIYSLTIGKVFSPFALGSYSNARLIGNMPSENLVRIAQRAVYPRLCLYQNDPERLRENLRDYMRISVFIIAPMLMILGGLSKPLTLALIGDQWSFTARLLSILCFYFLMYPINSINLMIPEITGNGGLYLKLQLTGIVVGTAMLAGMIPFGLPAVCAGLAVTSFIFFLINSMTAGKSVSFGLKDQVIAVGGIVINALVAGVVTYSLTYIIKGEVPQIIWGSLIGLIIYAALSITFQGSMCDRIYELLQNKTRKQQ